MRRYIFWSVALHTIIAAGLILFSSAGSRGNSYPEVYRVNIMGKSPMQGRATGNVKRPEDRSSKQLSKSPVKPKDIHVRDDDIKPAGKISRSQENGTEATNSGSKKNDDYPDFLDGVDFGDEFGGIRIDETGFESSYYVNLIFSKIRSRWINPVRYANLIETTIYFQVSSSGKIGEAQIEISSGIDAFDQSALRAILTSDPLPPLPQEFSGDYIGIHLKFEYAP